MSMHPITGVTRLTLAGETRSLACDMNAAAVLHEIVGPRWSEWLVSRFMGTEVEGGRYVEPMSPADVMTALYALLASDREDSGRVESLKSLSRALPVAGMADVQLAMVRCVLASFGLPGEVIEAVEKAVDEPRKKAAHGTGTKQ